MKQVALKYSINQSSFNVVKQSGYDGEQADELLRFLLSHLFLQKNEDTLSAIRHEGMVAIGYIQDNVAYCFKQAVTKALATHHHQIIDEPQTVRIQPLDPQDKLGLEGDCEDGYDLLSQRILRHHPQAESLGFDQAVQGDQVITLYAECAMMSAGAIDYPVVCEMLTVYRLGSNSTGFTLDKSDSETLAMTKGDSGQVNTCYFVVRLENLDYLELDLANLDGTLVISSNANDLTADLQRLISQNNPSEAVNVLTDDSNQNVAVFAKDETGLYAFKEDQKDGNPIQDGKVILYKNDEGKLVVASENRYESSLNVLANTLILQVQQKATARNLQPQFTLKRLGCQVNPKSLRLSHQPVGVLVGPAEDY